MARSSLPLDFAKFLWVMGIFLAKGNPMTLVAIIGYQSMSRRWNQIDQTRARKDLGITTIRLEWTIHPHKFAFTYHNV